MSTLLPLSTHLRRRDEGVNLTFITGSIIISVAVCLLLALIVLFVRFRRNGWQLSKKLNVRFGFGSGAKSESQHFCNQTDTFTQESTRFSAEPVNLDKRTDRKIYTRETEMISIDLSPIPPPTLTAITVAPTPYNVTLSPPPRTKQRPRPTATNDLDQAHTQSSVSLARASSTNVQSRPPIPSFASDDMDIFIPPSARSSVATMSGLETSSTEGSVTDLPSHKKGLSLRLSVG